MAIATLVRITDPARLLERAVEGLFPLDPPSAARPWPTLRAWLVLRQGGLRDDLHRLAAARGVAGWFDPPVCLFNELGALWGDGEDATALTEQERHAILARLLDERGRALLGAATDAWVPVVDRLFGELVGEGIDPDAFGEAMQRIARDAHDRLRAETLGGVFVEWHASLKRAGRTDGRDLKVRLARRIAEDPNAVAERLGHRREVRIVGLADLRGGWRPLLEALAATSVLDRVEVLTSVDLPLPATFAREGGTAAPALPTPPALHLWETPDSAREAELVAVQVRALIDGGTPPARIAIIARQARPAVDMIATALTSVGVPVTARRRVALAETAPARALSMLLDAARERWSRHALVELAEHPLVATGLDARVLNMIGYSRAMGSRTAWREALAELLAKAEARERGDAEQETRRAALPSSASVKAVIGAWDSLAPRLAFLDESHFLEEWCAWVRRVVRDDAWGIGTSLEREHADPLVRRDDLRARDAITAIIDAWLDAFQRFGATGAPMDAARFADRLSLMLAQDLVTPPSTAFGVVVAEALAAGWRSFDHVFVVGMTAGEFPRRPAPGQLIDGRERAALIAEGLPLDEPDAWRAREAELFRVIAAGASRSLTLGWPIVDAAGQEVARSVFIDETVAALADGVASLPGVDESADARLERSGTLVRFPPESALVDGFPSAPDATTLALARESAARERERTEDPSPWNGGIDDAALVAALASRYDERYQWSATQLEQAAKCRWHWFAARQLALETVGEADDEMEPTVGGSIRHEALARFFERAGAERGKPVYLRSSDLAWALPAIARALDEAWDAAIAAGEWLGPPALHAVAKAELRRGLEEYLRFEVTQVEDSYNPRKRNAPREVRAGAIENELEFKDLEMTVGDIRFRLRGSIDRVDEGVDDRIPDARRYLAAIDYKSSLGSTPAAGKPAAWDDGIVLQVPLYARALELLHPDRAVARMEYRTLRSPKVVHPLRLVEVQPKEGAVIEPPEARARLERALAHAGRVIASIRSATVPARPTASAGCPPFCPARDVCRIPGGPRKER